MRGLAARGLAIGYGGVAIARGVDLSIQQGEITCLLGPNGVGKTTLFKTLLGLLPALGGAVTVDGVDISRMRRADIARVIAYVPQSHPPDFAYTVRDLVVMGRTAGLGAFKTPGRADIEAASRALDTLGVANLADRDATRISGGQLQLALIARALAQEATVIVMDEPTASLDIANRVLVLETVRSLAERGHAIVMSTHEPEHAFAVAHFVAALGPQNHFVAGPVEEVLTDEELSRLYGVDLRVERAPSGRVVVGPREKKGSAPLVI